MQNNTIYHKNKIIEMVDEMLNKKMPFKKIAEFTGWTMEELWIYIDMVYRKKYPKQCEINKKYFCWGETKRKTR